MFYSGTPIVNRYIAKPMHRLAHADNATVASTTKQNELILLLGLSAAGSFHLSDTEHASVPLHSRFLVTMTVDPHIGKKSCSLPMPGCAPPIPIAQFSPGL